eukprot:374964-Amphidinium_carterae.1
MDVFLFTKHTESRWLSIGRIAKRLVASSVLGFFAILRMAVQQKHAASVYYSLQKHTCQLPKRLFADVCAFGHVHMQGA